jgi:hypothetical protein
MPLTRTPPASVVGINLPRPKDLPEDDPTLHTEVGRSSLVNSDDIAPAFARAAEMLADISPPPAFRRLPVAVVFDITRDLQLRRRVVGDSDDPLVLVYDATGRYICPELTLDRVWHDHDREVDRAKVITVALRPLPPARMTRNGYELPSIDDARRMAVEDCQALCMWHYDPATGRTWRAGEPHPDPVTDDDPATWAMLSARARRSISREVRKAIDDSPRSELAGWSYLDGSPTLSFTVDGRCLGWATPLMGPENTPDPTKCIRVRVGPDADHADIDPWLDRVRVGPDGVVVMT